MSRAVMCDRCGTLAKAQEEGIPGWETWHKSWAVDAHSADLCPKCAVEFGEWLDLKGDGDAGSAEH